MVLGHFAQIGQLFCIWLVTGLTNHIVNFPGQAAGHLAGDRIPMPLIKNKHGDNLHQDHRHQNNAQHPPEQGFRHVIAQLHDRVGLTS